MPSLGYGSVQLGTDPEFFFLKKDTGEVFPADKLLPSVLKKRTLYKDAWNSKGFGIASQIPTVEAHFDGLQGELTLKETLCRQYLISRLREGMRAMHKLAENNDLVLDISSAKTITKEILADATPEARNFGCDMDFISWLGGMPNTLGVDPLNHFIRYSGGHIHVGFVDYAGEDNHVYNRYKMHFKGASTLDKVREILINEKLRVVQLMDYLVGNTMVLLDQSPESTLRRQLYGKAGVFRAPPHGIEYRVLSNFFLRHPALFSLVLALSREVIAAFLTSSEHVDTIMAAVPPEDIIVAINNNDKELAFRNWMAIRKTVTFYENDLKEKQLRAIEFMAMVGVDEVIGSNLYDNWRLDINEVSNHNPVLTPAFSEAVCDVYNGGTRLFGNRSAAKEFDIFLSKFDPNEIYV